MSNEEDEYHDLDDKYTDIRIEKLDKDIDQNRVRIKEDDALKLVETVFDNKTRLILYKIINKGYFRSLEGAISTGKEANVYYATTQDSGIAVKIFRIDSPSFKKMHIYVQGDPRFKRFRNSRSGFLEIWAKKEYKNLQRMQVHGIPAPNPIYVERNILLMEFLGDGDSVLPRLKEADIKDPVNLYERIMKSVKDLYQKCNLIHADLSEYNILYDSKIDYYYFIDVSQSVLSDHPQSDLFLLRDIRNINRFFDQFTETKSIEVLFKWICKRSFDEKLLLEL